MQKKIFKKLFCFYFMNNSVILYAFAQFYRHTTPKKREYFLYLKKKENNFFWSFLWTCSENSVLFAQQPAILVFTWPCLESVPLTPVGVRVRGVESRSLTVEWGNQEPTNGVHSMPLHFIIQYRLVKVFALCRLNRSSEGQKTILSVNQKRANQIS